MRKQDVKIGETYLAKVSGVKRCAVRIDSVCVHTCGGWNATNIETGRQVHVKTAARLTQR